MARDTMDVCLRVLRDTKKSRFDSYSVRNVPCFETVFQLKQHFLENCQAEISPATDTTFQIGYYAEGNKKFSISSEIQLAEAFSLVKNGKITLWVDPHKDVPRSSLGRKRKGNSSVQDDSGDGEEEGSYESCLSRRRGKHDLPEFKLRCWARMVVNRTHNSEDTPPNVPFFTGISKASKPSKTVRSGEFSTQSMDNAERKAREAFLNRCMRPFWTLFAY
ncbi:unnamed protein product [Porites lobata]|uniref:PB1 domain-containing protein n=1 Tax=Porites lobata TaxID=104759 RepID=A0ABN8QMT2_9CNID|nr:unnamed protein product [Porites lobata]